MFFFFSTSLIKINTFQFETLGTKLWLDAVLVARL